MESVETTVVIPILLASRLASVLFPVPLVPASREDDALLLLQNPV